MADHHEAKPERCLCTAAVDLISSLGKSDGSRKNRCFEVVIVMMRKRFAAVIAALAVFGCCSSVNVQAQTDSCTQYFALQKAHPACLDGWPPLDFAHLPP